MNFEIKTLLKMLNNPGLEITDSPSCPVCKKILDGATSCDERDAKPESGSISICVYCGEVSKYMEREGKLVLESFSQDELDQFPEEIKKTIELTRIAIVQRLQKEEGVSS